MREMFRLKVARRPGRAERLLPLVRRSSSRLSHEEPAGARSARDDEERNANRCCNANPSSISRRASASPETKQPQPRSISALATSCVRPIARQIAMASSSSRRAAPISPLKAASPRRPRGTGACGPRFHGRVQRLRQDSAPLGEMRVQPPEPS